MSSTDLNNDAWQVVFDRYEVLKSIASDGIFKIQAKEIKNLENHV